VFIAAAAGDAVCSVLSNSDPLSVPSCLYNIEHTLSAHWALAFRRVLLNPLDNAVLLAVSSWPTTPKLTY
jgi:hypothetical protein